MKPQDFLTLLAVAGLFAACSGKSNTKAAFPQADGGTPPGVDAAHAGIRDGGEPLWQTILGSELIPPTSTLEQDLLVPAVDEFSSGLQPLR